VFLGDVITVVDKTITIGIRIVEVFRSNVIDIFTIPSTMTNITFIWVETVEVFRFWAVLGSPFIFTHDNTVVNFTSVKLTVIISITVF
jgi:hypothetical protein